MDGEDKRYDVYRQANTAVFIDEIPVTGLAGGTSIRVRYLGVYEVEVEIDLRETSPSHEEIFSRCVRWHDNGEGSTLRITTGSGRTITLANASVSLPSPLFTGDKTQGMQTYTFRSRMAKFY